LGQDQYPKTITAATDALSNHKIDPNFYDNQRKNRGRAKKERSVPTKDDERLSTSSHYIVGVFF
jgi:hypothetical protein